jgi:hypothetical protein
VIPGKGTGTAGEPTRNVGRILSLLADAVRWTTPAVRQVDMIPGGDGQPVALVLRFFDGEAWTVATTPHRDPDRPAGPVVQQLAEGVTYISHDGGPDPTGEER